jgi:hypothetical protein
LSGRDRKQLVSSDSHQKTPSGFFLGGLQGTPRVIVASGRHEELLQEHGQGQPRRSVDREGEARPRWQLRNE